MPKATFQNLVDLYEAVQDVEVFVEQARDLYSEDVDLQEICKVEIAKGTMKTCYLYSSSVFKIISLDTMQEKQKMLRFIRSESLMNAMFGNQYQTEFVGIYEHQKHTVFVVKQPYVVSMLSGKQKERALEIFLSEKGFGKKLCSFRDIVASFDFQDPCQMRDISDVLENGVFVNDMLGLILYDVTASNYAADSNGKIFLYDGLLFSMKNYKRRL